MSLKLNQTKISKKGRYFSPGKYPKVRIDAIKLVKRRQNKGELFVAECTILDKPEGELAQGPGRCSWTMKMELDAAASNIKELLVAASGIDPQDEAQVEAAEHDWDQVYELAIGEDQALKDALISIEAFNKSTDGGGTYTRCRFFPVEE